MKKLILLFLVSFIFSPLFSQLLDNKLDVYISASLDVPVGAENYKENDFISPNLFANYKPAVSLSARAVMPLIKRFSIGIAYSQSRFNRWEGIEEYNQIYENSFSKIKALAAVFRYSSLKTESGSRNRYSYYVDLSPTYNIISVQLDSTLFNREVGGEYLIYSTEMTHSQIIGFGADLTCGVKKDFSNKMGAFADVGIKFIKPIDPIFFNDKLILLPSVQLGVYVKFFLDKQYYLKTY